MKKSGKIICLLSMLCFVLTVFAQVSFAANGDAAKLAEDKSAVEARLKTIFMTNDISTEYFLAKLQEAATNGSKIELSDDFRRKDAVDMYHLGFMIGTLILTYNNETTTITTEKVIGVPEKTTDDGTTAAKPNQTNNDDVTSVAKFSDVASDAYYNSAVQTLSTLNILKGYADGSFRPNNNITRAEFCTVVCRALGLENAVPELPGNSQTDNIFKDVPKDHWAINYIAVAAGNKIVSGMGDGTFEPESNVTYEQAVKMLIVALGYEPMAAAKGGWPDVYLETAKKYGVTKNVSVVNKESDATRATVAQLVYNALPVPVMEQTEFGTESTYTIMDGYGDFPYKSLITKLGAAKIEGKAVDTADEKYNKITCDADELIYLFNNANGNVQWTEYIKKNADKSGYALYTFKVADGIDIAQYLNIPSVIYVKKLDDGNDTIIYIMPAEEK